MDQEQAMPHYAQLQTAGWNSRDKMARAAIEKTMGIILALLIANIMLTILIPIFASVRERGTIGITCTTDYMDMKLKVAQLSIWFLPAPKLGDGTLEIRPDQAWFAAAKAQCISRGVCKAIIKDLNKLNYATVPQTRCAGGACENLYYCMFKGKETLDSNSDGTLTDDEVENGDLTNAEDTSALASSCIQVANYIKTREEYLRAHYSAAEYGGTTSNVFARPPP